MIPLLIIIALLIITLTYICYHYLRKLIEAVGSPVPVTIEAPIESEPVRKEASLLVDTDISLLIEVRDELIRQGKTVIG